MAFDDPEPAKRRAVSQRMLTRQLQYGPTAKAFHWAVVLLLVVQAPLGWIMHGAAP